MALSPEQIAKKGDEASHQKALFQWLALHQHLHPVFGSKLIFAVVNEQQSGEDAKTKAIRGSIRQAMGCKAGVSDVVILFPSANNRYTCFCLELKKPDGKVSEEQAKFRMQLAELNPNVLYAVAFGWEDAVSFVCTYLGVTRD